MREVDDAALELRLRGVLREHLGALPLDLTVDALDRRRELRDAARRRRRGGLVALGLAAALLVPLGVLVGGGRPLFEALVVPVPSASPDALATPEASTGAPSARPSVSAPNPTPAATPGAPTVADPHALLVVTSRIATTPPLCVNVDRLGTRDGSSRRVVDCAESLEVTRDGTSAALAGPRGMTIVDLGDGHEIGTIDTGQYTFPTAWSPSGRWLLWSSCRTSRSDSDTCSVYLSARDGSGRHELYRGDDGYASSITWLPDESRVAVPTDGSGSVLVGAADGSDLRPVAPGGPEYGWAGAFDAGVIDVAPDGRSYLYLDGPPRTDCGSICMAALAGRHVTGSLRGSERRPGREPHEPRAGAVRRRGRLVARRANARVPPQDHRSGRGQVRAAGGASRGTRSTVAARCVGDDPAHRGRRAAGAPG